jgi:hypothetical protein
MTALWAGGVGVVAVVAVVLVAAMRERHSRQDLGAVSARWLSEERAHERPYSKP